MSNKRNFLDSYSKEFDGIVKRAKNDDEFHCIPCNVDISLATSGKTSITKHLVQKECKSYEHNKGDSSVCNKLIRPNKY